LTNARQISASTHTVTAKSLTKSRRREAGSSDQGPAKRPTSVSQRVGLLLLQRLFKFLLRISNEALVVGRGDRDTRAFLLIAPKLSQQIEVAPVCAKKHIARPAVQQGKRMPKILSDAGIACRPVWAGDKWYSDQNETQPTMTMSSRESPE
jgi:hypothetical protein